MRLAPRRPAVPLAMLALAASVGLGGCSSGPQFAPACPSLALLPDAADLTRYSANGQDLTDLVADARIVAVPASCTYDDSGKVRATLKVAMAVVRGPAATSAQIPLPYFVAVMDGDRVLDRQDYTVVAKFASNANRALPTGEAIELLLPVTTKKSAAAYSIYVGYELTPEELALNRKRGAR